MSAHSDDGQGLPVVLLHGFANDRRLWREQVAALAGRYRIVAMDLIGHGNGTSADGRAVTMDAYADDVAATMGRLGIERAVVGGISLGGYVAMALALRHPGRVLGTVLANTRAIGDTQAQKDNRDKLAAAIGARGAQAVVDAFVDKPLRPDAPEALKAEIRAMNLRQPPAGLVSATLGMRDRPDRTPELARISQPSLVITGSADVFIPPSESEPIHRGIPGSAYANLDGGGHLSCIDSPSQFNAALEAFLAPLARKHSP